MPSKVNQGQATVVLEVNWPNPPDMGAGEPEVIWSTPKTLLTTKVRTARIMVAVSSAKTRARRASRAYTARSDRTAPTAATAMAPEIISRRLESTMEVVKITPRGYCHGVVDAFRIAKRVRE